MAVKLYKVGGCVRDKILGVKTKDIDFSVEASSYEEMKNYILSRGKIFVENPEFLTIRAIINKEAADFVLARKESGYADGRHPDIVEPGTIFDDLSRRDFRINAIAEDENGNLIDPFNGMQDIADKTIRCVGNTLDRFSEDALRMLRAVRFSITKDFTICEDIQAVLVSPHVYEGIRNVSSERIREELTKCFKHDTLGTLRLFDKFRGFRDTCFNASNGMWLKPTFEE